MMVNHVLHLWVMCSKSLNVDVVPLCLVNLDKGGNELRFPTTHHSHSLIQSWFTAPALLLLLTLVILPQAQLYTMPTVHLCYFCVFLWGIWYSKGIFSTHKYYTWTGLAWEAKVKGCVTDSAQRAICHVEQINQLAGTWSVKTDLISCWVLWLSHNAAHNTILYFYPFRVAHCMRVSVPMSDAEWLKVHVLHGLLVMMLLWTNHIINVRCILLRHYYKV